MESDCCQHVKRCTKCQIYTDNIHVAPSELHNIALPWFVHHVGLGYDRFILGAIDYFTKWVEVASYVSVTKSVVVKFIKRDIICGYGLLVHIIIDNGTNLNNNMMIELCEQFKIKHHNSTPYRHKMNGAVEAANKNIKKIVQKMVATYKDWHDMLPYALHEYRTSVQTSTKATPYSLVYGTEAVLLVEVEIPSLRVLAKVELSDTKWVQSRLDQVKFIEEKQLSALCHGQLYQHIIKHAFDKKVMPRWFKEGDLVLRKMLPNARDPRGKWTPNYEGPYIVKHAFSGGALILVNPEGQELQHLVKLFYP
ncbi:Gypsy retrotransposon integrase-like protein 1, partial [Mucuna pruriens]